ncbi:MAG: hypothetical protein KDC24_04480 [Saprospiraceae bacterium]|nr:hypothetical protein [Saprospiraceae bacterium]
MLPFFRRIRQQLFKEKKLSNYLFYALGEIVLVVIGILLALQLNTWNAARQDAISEEIYLKRIADDINNQLVPLTDYISSLEVSAKEAVQVLDEFKVKGSMSQVDSINFRLQKMMKTRTFPVVNSTFLELNSSGQMQLIQNKALRSNLIRYYQQNEEWSETIRHNLTDVIYKEAFPVITGTAILDVSQFNTVVKLDFEKLDYPVFLKNYQKEKLDDPETVLQLVKAINLYILVSYRNKGLMEEAKAEAEKLLDQIELYQK